MWRMRIESRIPKATNTNSEYVTIIAFPLQQWLHERTCYTYIARLALPAIAPPLHHNHSFLCHPDDNLAHQVSQPPLNNRTYSHTYCLLHLLRYCPTRLNGVPSHCIAIGMTNKRFVYILINSLTSVSNYLFATFLLFHF